MEADQLDLLQVASLEETGMQVATVATGPAGKLRSYQTHLQAEPAQDGTQVQIEVDLAVAVTVFPLFKSVAQKRVQAAADSAADQQAAALHDFVDRYSNDVFILPEIN